MKSFIKYFLVALVSFLLISSPVYSYGGHKTHSTTSHFTKSRSVNSERPYYGGGHHTTSHGGHYTGGHGSAHKGGHYVNPKTANHYGIHKLSK